jgi:radical SAM superfamily enzyme YgiQ (UPF0313 family)
MLQVMKKRVTLTKMLASLRAAEREGLRTRVSIIIGHPDEQRRDMWRSLKFLVRAAVIGSYDASVMVFAPYPGSADFNRLLNDGSLEISDSYYYVALSRGGRSSKTYNAQMGRHELFCRQLGMLLTFYTLAYVLRPWRFVELIRGLVTGKEENIVHQTIRTKLQQFRNLRRQHTRP